MLTVVVVPDDHFRLIACRCFQKYSEVNLGHSILDNRALPKWREAGQRQAHVVVLYASLIVHWWSLRRKQVFHFVVGRWRVDSLAGADVAVWEVSGRSWQEA